MGIYTAPSFTEYDQPIRPDGETRTGQDLDADFYRALTAAVADSGPRLHRLAVNNSTVPTDGQIGQYNANSAQVNIPLGSQPEGSLVGLVKTDSSSNAVVATWTGGGGGTVSIPYQNELLLLVSLGGGSWQPIGSWRPSGATDARNDARNDLRYAQLNDARLLAGQMVARGARTSSNVTTGSNTTSLGIVEVGSAPGSSDGIPVTAGRLYRVRFAASIAGPAAANASLTISLTYTFAASGAPAAVTLTSTTLRAASYPTRADAGFTFIVCEAFYPATTTGLLKLLSGVAGDGKGAYVIGAQPTYPASLTVDDVGVDPGNTGVDR